MMENAKLKEAIDVLRICAEVLIRTADEIERVFKNCANVQYVDPSRIEDSVTLQELIQLARDAKFVKNPAVFTSLQNVMVSEGIHTAGALRSKITKWGKPTLRYNWRSKWYRLPNMGRVKVSLLIAIIDHFKI